MVIVADTIKALDLENRPADPLSAAVKVHYNSRPCHTFRQCFAGKSSYYTMLQYIMHLLSCYAISVFSQTYLSLMWLCFAHRQYRLGSNGQPQWHYERPAFLRPFVVQHIATRPLLSGFPLRISLTATPEFCCKAALLLSLGWKAAEAD